MKIDYRLIGQRIKERRKAMHKTQDNLAEALAVSVGYISQIERGVTKISLDTLAKIATALDCSIAELIEGTSPSQKEYFNQEIQDACLRLNPKQRRLLLEMAHLISKYQ